MAVAYEYTEEMMNQLNAIRGDKTAFRKLRHQFRKELGLHTGEKSKKSEKVEKIIEELNPVINEPKTTEETEMSTPECMKVESETEREYTTANGDVITIVAG